SPWQSVRTAGRVFVAGSSVFATSSPTTDVFVAKFDPDGNIVYSTYFGGSANDKPAGIAVAADGSVYIAGSTQSPDFPTTPGTFLTDAPANGGSFVLKLNPDGALAWSTYLADNRTTIYSIALNANAEPYVAGNTFGGLPTTPGAF